MVPEEVREKVRDQLAVVDEQMEQAGYELRLRQTCKLAALSPALWRGCLQTRLLLISQVHF